MSNLISINTDSCSVMRGKKSLFSTQLQLTRNILVDRSHKLTEPKIEAKKVVKSAGREGPTDCCFYYKVTTDHHNNLKS